MTLLFAEKKSQAAAGVSETEGLPPDAARPNRQTKKIRKRKTRGKGGKINYNN